MDVLQRITELREGRKWSEYQLAEKSGLSQSTISSWYHKNLIPSIPSLECICKAFNITLSQFFLDQEPQAIFLTQEQISLINATNKLTPDQFSSLLLFLEKL